jgi:hypothetical protein
VNLDEMPLDTEEHILAAWQLVTRQTDRILSHKPPDPFIPPLEQLAAARDRILLAAIEHGLGDLAR